MTIKHPETGEEIEVEKLKPGEKIQVGDLYESPGGIFRELPFSLRGLKFSGWLTVVRPKSSITSDATN